jgi:hypothetical protein
VAAVYRGYIAIEKGFFFPTDYSIPASAVAILREGLTLLLLVVWDLAGPDPRDFSQKMLDIEGFEHDLHPHRLEVGLELLDHLDGRRAHDDGTSRVAGSSLSSSRNCQPRRSSRMMKSSRIRSGRS